ncbi:MAG: hypothetical protein ACLFR1_13185, partial [Spirochaetia bacterium]
YCLWAIFFDVYMGRRFFIVNLHLDHQNQRVNENAALQLVGLIRDHSQGLPAVICGDFNSRRKSKTQEVIVREYSRVLENTQQGTYNTPIPLQIDQIFINTQFRCKESTIEPAKRNEFLVSDHKIITAVLELID